MLRYCAALVCIASTIVLGAGSALFAAETEPYAVVISSSTRALKDWSEVADLLVANHAGQLIVCTNGLAGCEGDLKRLQPRYVCFVAKPEEISVELVRNIHLLSRKMDEDIFADFMWGIVTGPSAADARRIVQTRKPLVIRTALTTTGMDFDLVDTALTLSDAERGKWSHKSNGQVVSGSVTNGSTDELFRGFWSTNDVDLLLTSGHATQVNLEMSWGLGAVVCASNTLYTLDRSNFMRWVQKVSRGAASEGFWFASRECANARADWASNTTASRLRTSVNPKVFFGVGNCLIGDTLQSNDSMVTAWLGQGGVCQFVGYTVPTWYGKAGWGALELWQGYAGHLSLAEAVFLNNQRILQKLSFENPNLLKAICYNENPGSRENKPLAAEVSRAPKNKQRDEFGMVYDRDTLVLYGDPMWEARFDAARQKSPIDWQWNESTSGLTLTIKARKDFEASDLPFMLPRRVFGLQAEAAAAPDTTLDENFVLLRTLKLLAAESKIIQFTVTK